MNPTFTTVFMMIAIVAIIILFGLFMYKCKYIKKQLLIQKQAEVICQNTQREYIETLNLQKGITYKIKKENGKFYLTMWVGQLIHKLGLSKMEIVEMEISEFLPQRLYEEVLPFYQKAWSGEVVNFEFELNDIYVYITLNPIFLNDKVVEIIGSGIDVTDLKQTQKSLEENGKMYRLALSSMAEGLIVIDKDGKIIVANVHASEIFGLPAEQLLASNLFKNNINWTLFRENMTILSMADFSAFKTIKHQMSFQNEIIGIQKNSQDRIVWLSINSEPLLGENVLIGAIVTLVDITKQKTQEFELIESTKKIQIAMEKVEKVNKAKSELFSKMSHELRTPLNSILGFAEILLDDVLDPLTSTQRSRVGKIKNAGNHLLKFITEILNLSKIEAGKLPISIQSVNVLEDVKECIQLIEPLASQKNITISHDYDSLKKLCIMVDPLWFKQITLNLLSNSILYNHVNGSVKVKCHVDNEKMTMSVIDTGIGMSNDTLEKIFEPFYRLHPGEEGTGIGLPLVKQLITLMNGDFGVESELGKGSCFWFSLPLEEKAKHYLNENDSNEKVVVYVEDNQLNITLMEEIFSTKPGIKLFIATTGEKGLQLIKTEKPALILLDIRLPDISGYEVLKKIKKDNAIKHIPTIAISANSLESDIQFSLGQGFEAYITKPYNLDYFNQVIEPYLQ